MSGRRDKLCAEALAEAKRILDAEARRILAERLEDEEQAA